MKAIDKLAGLGERLRRRSERWAGDQEPARSVPVGAVAAVGWSAEAAGPEATRSGEIRSGEIRSGEIRSDEGDWVDPQEEAALWERLRADPNDVDAFPRLAEIVRRHAAAGHADADKQRAADDAVWALAEELAHNARAWYPLIEMARLSVHDDREAALRRLATASDRDPSGRALATGLAVLREADCPSDALGIGMAHWRPREHDLEAGRHLVLAAVEARRLGDARRHLDALSSHPDAGRVAKLRAELEGLVRQLEAERAAGGPMTDPAGISVTGPLSTGIDLRDVVLPEEKRPPRFP